MALTLAPGCSSPPAGPTWAQTFAYAPSDLRAIEVGAFGFPFVPVRIGDTRLMLPFDTGNMVGVNVSSVLFERLGLPGDASYDRVNSAGALVATLRVANAVHVSFLGRDLGPTQVYELDTRSLPGLVGPTLLAGGHFTLDYPSRTMGLGTAALPTTVPGFQQIPLVRSSRHPMLILVRGTIEGRRVLIELDTGKSRTVINPALASDLALTRGPHGVAINSLRIGTLSFEVPSAKRVDQTAIDPTLPELLLAGVGSDILSRFAWTVDYDAGELWVPSSL